MRVTNASFSSTSRSTILNKLRLKQLSAEFEKLNTMIQELKRENAALKQQNYELELKIKNYSQFDEKVLLQITQNRILNAEIDRLNKLLAEREEELSELRIRFSDEAALTKRINEHLALFVVLFAEIESLRKRVKDTEKEFGDFRRSSLAPYRN
jgi:DNA repair exonuclease SbcCD ATPase subunit